MTFEEGTTTGAQSKGLGKTQMEKAACSHGGHPREETLLPALPGLQPSGLRETHFCCLSSICEAAFRDLRLRQTETWLR